MKFPFFLLLFFLLASCSPESIKEGINKTGDIAGQTAGEFVEGVAQGVEKAFELKIKPNASLTGKGISFGKATVKSDTIGTDNLLIVYTIFNKDYSGSITAKVFDEKGIESGRSTVSLNAKANDARHLEFRFDKHTNIESNYSLMIE